MDISVWVQHTLTKVVLSIGIYSKNIVKILKILSSKKIQYFRIPVKFSE